MRAKWGQHIAKSCFFYILILDNTVVFILCGIV